MKLRLLLIISVLIISKTAQADAISDAYDAGYDNGYSSGYEAGYDAGTVFMPANPTVAMEGIVGETQYVPVVPGPGTVMMEWRNSSGVMSPDEAINGLAAENEMMLD